jgi:hypothetical protein
MEVKPNSSTLAINPQNGYKFSDDKKFQPLLNPPKPDQTKYDQALGWTTEQSKNYC